MASMYVNEIRAQVGEATRKLRRVLLGKVLADAWDCDPSNISKAETNGHGEIRKVIDSLLACRAAEQYEAASAADVEDAIKTTLRVICRAGRYHCYKPISHHTNIQDLLEAGRATLDRASVVLHEINEAMNPAGALGRDVDAVEARHVEAACDDLIETMLALKEYVKRNHASHASHASNA